MNESTLHRLISGRRWELALKALNRNPGDASNWNVNYDSSEGMLMSKVLPIHTACALNPPMEIIQALLAANPSGAREVDNKGFLAIHYACSNFALKEVICLLVREYPDSVNVTDPDGMLPLHHAALWGPSCLDVVKILLKTTNENIISSTVDGATALDLANNTSYELKELVVLQLQRSGYFSHPKPLSNNPSLLSHDNFRDESTVTSTKSKKKHESKCRDTCQQQELSSLDTELIVAKKEALEREVEELKNLNHLQNGNLHAIELLKIEIKELKNQCELHKVNNEALEIQVEKLQNENKHQKVDIANKENLEMEVERLGNQNRDQNLNIEGLKKKVEELQNQNDLHRINNETLEKQVGKLKDDNHRQTINLADNEALKIEVKNLKFENNFLKVDLIKKGDVEAQMKKLQKENDLQKINFAQSEDLKIAVKKLQNENDLTKGTNEVLRVEYNKLRNQNSLLIVKVQKLHKLLLQKKSSKMDTYTLRPKLCPITP